MKKKIIIMNKGKKVGRWQRHHQHGDSLEDPQDLVRRPVIISFIGSMGGFGFGFGYFFFNMTIVQTSLFQKREGRTAAAVFPCHHLHWVMGSSSNIYLPSLYCWLLFSLLRYLQPTRAPQVEQNMSQTTYFPVIIYRVWRSPSKTLTTSFIRCASPVFPRQSFDISCVLDDKCVRQFRHPQMTNRSCLCFRQISSVDGFSM